MTSPITYAQAAARANITPAVTRSAARAASATSNLPPTPADDKRITRSMSALATTPVSTSGVYRSTTGNPGENLPGVEQAGEQGGYLPGVRQPEQGRVEHLTKPQPYGPQAKQDELGSAYQQHDPSRGSNLADLFDLITNDTESLDPTIKTHLEDETKEALATRVAVTKMVATEDGSSFQPKKVPRNFREATTGEDSALYWDAMRVEIEHHKRAGTWKLVPRPKKGYIMGSTWSYDLKLNGDQRIKKGKGRLCAQGFTAREGSEYMFKYSSTAGLDTFRLFFAHAAQQGWVVHEADYSTAYLNAPIDTFILMEQPKGFEEKGPDGEEMVCLLQRAIYGLPQSGRLWQSTIPKR